MATELRASGNDVVSFGPYYSQVTRPLRSLRVSLEVDRVGLPRYSLDMSPADSMLYEKRSGERRLKVLADKISIRFKMPRKLLRVRYNRGGYVLFVPIWEGKGTPADRKKLDQITAYVAEVARTI